MQPQQETKKIQDKLKGDLFLSRFFQCGLDARKAVQKLQAEGLLPENSSKNQSALANRLIKENITTIYQVFEINNLGADKFAHYVNTCLSSFKNEMAVAKIVEIWAKVMGYMIERRITKDMTPNRPDNGDRQKELIERMNERLEKMKHPLRIGDKGETIIVSGISND